MNDTKEKADKAEARTIDRMIRKVRSDSNWHGLTFEQCETVEEWLFEDNLSYTETAERIRKEFGRETSRSSVGRFYGHRAQLRRATELVDAQVAADQIHVVPAKTGDMREAAVKLLAQKAVVLATEKPEDVAGLMSLTKVLLESEENEIRLRRVKLEERYYDLQANTVCAAELQKVRTYLRTVGDNEYLNEKEKIGLVVKLLYGKDKIDVEEAAQLGFGDENSGNKDGEREEIPRNSA
jgi:hypothetical protein